MHDRNPRRKAIATSGFQYASGIHDQQLFRNQRPGNDVINSLNDRTTTQRLHNRSAFYRQSLIGQHFNVQKFSYFPLVLRHWPNHRRQPSNRCFKKLVIFSHCSTVVALRHFLSRNHQILTVCCNHTQLVCINFSLSRRPKRSISFQLFWSEFLTSYYVQPN